LKILKIFRKVYTYLLVNVKLN